MRTVRPPGVVGQPGPGPQGNCEPVSAKRNRSRQSQRLDGVLEATANPSARNANRSRPGPRAYSGDWTFGVRDQTANWRPIPAGLQSPRPQRPAEFGPPRPSWRSRRIPGLGGWGGRIRTSAWRNQNQLDYPTISTRIWKNRLKTRSSNFNGLVAICKEKMQNGSPREGNPKKAVPGGHASSPIRARRDESKADARPRGCDYGAIEVVTPRKVVKPSITFPSFRDAMPAIRGKEEIKTS
jgi:hypothetical protein